MDIFVEQTAVFKSAFQHKEVNSIVEEIYKQCFYDYFERLYSYAFTIVKDNGEAKDIVQTAFIALWEKRNTVNLGTSARSYLYTSVYHLALNNIRNRKIRQSHQEYLVPKEITNTYTLEDTEIRIRIQKAIDSLPARCKEVFCKSRLDGKKYAEIASDMGISIKTVEVQMGKALKMLRELLADLVMIWMIYLLI